MGDDTGLSLDDEERTQRERDARDHAILERDVARLGALVLELTEPEPGDSVVDTAMRLLRDLHDRNRYVTRGEYDEACTQVALAHTGCGCQPKLAGLDDRPIETVAGL